MKRIRNVSLAALAALALTALVGVSSASAAKPGFEAEQYPAAISTSVPIDNQSLGFNSFNTACEAPALEAELTGGSEAITATPKNASCSTGELKFNGCKLTFHPGAGGTGTGTFDIGPAGCGPITIGHGTYCQVTIGAQSGLRANYENEGTGSSANVYIGPEVTGMTYTQVSGWGCEHKTFTNGVWSGISSARWIVKATHAGSATGLRAVAKTRDHIALVEGGGYFSPKLAAESYPVSLVGEQGTPLKLTTAYAGELNREMECETVQFNGSTSGETSKFALGEGTQSGCAVEVKMNGCQYSFHLDLGPTGGGFYEADPDIECPEGKSIEVIARSLGTTKCTTTIPGQTALGEDVLENKTWGSIDVDVDLSNIHYHNQAGSGFGACTTGDYTDGTYKGTINMVGYP